MPEEHDSWLKAAFGVDLAEAAGKVKDEVLATVEKVKGAVAQGAAAGASAAGAGAFPLGGSVGRGGKNAASDVRAVQRALGIAADGDCGPQTIAAIEAHQRKMGAAKPDGRVDAGGATERSLADGGGRAVAMPDDKGGGGIGAPILDDDYSGPAVGPRGEAMAGLSLNEYGRAANEAIAAWKRDMEKSGKELDGVCQELMKLQRKKVLTAEETKQLKECTRLSDGIRDYILAESKKLDSTLQSYKLKKDTDLGAFGKMQGNLGTLVKDGVPLGEHFSITLKPLKLNGGLFVIKGKF